MKKRSFLPTVILILGLSVFANSLPVLAQEEPKKQPAAKETIFKAQITGNDVNLRADSTVSSMVICSVTRGEQLEAVAELYDWYKVRLPVNAPSYIKKDLLAFNAETNETTVAGSSVNIRAKPDTGSQILGKVGSGEIVKVIEDTGEWCRIEPVRNSYGWVHKSLAKKIVEKPKPVVKKDDVKRLTVSGTLKAKTFKRVATHKLIANNGEVYLLRGDKEFMDSLNNKKVKITGKIKENSGTDNVLLMVESVEELK